MKRIQFIAGVTLLYFLFWLLFASLASIAVNWLFSFGTAPGTFKIRGIGDVLMAILYGPLLFCIWAVPCALMFAIILEWAQTKERDVQKMSIALGAVTGSALMSGLLLNFPQVNLFSPDITIPLSCFLGSLMSGFCIGRMAAQG